MVNWFNQADATYRGKLRELNELDMILQGARSLEGPNLRLDPRTRQLVDAGPTIAALAA